LASHDGDRLYAGYVQTVGDRIELTRKKLGISARELARRSGLGATQVSTIVRRYRQNPDAETAFTTLRAIAKGAGVSVSWLVSGTDVDSLNSHVPPGGPKSSPRECDALRRMKLLRALVESLHDMLGSGDHEGALTVATALRDLLEQAIEHATDRSSDGGEGKGIANADPRSK
jgi:transcriptional regulator with XRE-family HTH domain